MPTTKLTFPGSRGAQLAARLDTPDGRPSAFAIFAHCFTCSKDILAASRISEALVRHGIAVLRFDFTGLGASEGEFASTDFSSNVQDLKMAADHLRAHHGAPRILIGHSLGGTAVMAAAGDIPEVRAVATINASADAAHVLRSFAVHLEVIEKSGEAEVMLAGRSFRVRKDFIEDVRGQALHDRIATMNRALLVLHAPLDTVVGIENATRIFTSARHPKSFVALDGADHLLTKRPDAEYAGTVIAGWASRYLDSPQPREQEPVPPAKGVLVRETATGSFQQEVISGGHHMLADEPVDVGGSDSGPSPYDFLSAALGACTSMTLRMYANRKGLKIGRISVDVSHGKVHAQDCAECEGREGRIDRFERRITIEGGVPQEIEAKIVEIADKCPVHRTLEASSVIVTQLTSS
jgi:putative redox protein